MSRPALEVADIFRDHGPAWRRAHAGHVSLAQLKVMSAIEACRTAVLGGHVAACTACGHEHIAYNSCRNRHCPKCQGVAARDWLEARAADLLPVPYYHLVFTLPVRIADIAYTNKAVVYAPFALLPPAVAEYRRAIPKPVDLAAFSSSVSDTLFDSNRLSFTSFSAMRIKSFNLPISVASLAWRSFAISTTSVIAIPSSLLELLRRA